MWEIFSFSLLALVLGFKHSYDADHLLAVSNILRKTKSMKESAKNSLNWAVGHMLTAAIITIMLFLSKDSISFSYFEKIVGAMLIAFGLFALLEFFQFHSHRHKHGRIEHSHFHIHANEKTHYHRHMLGIGIVQGLAGNDELLILLAASLSVLTLGTVLIGIGFFSIGVVIGMLLFSAAFSYPLIKSKSEKIYRMISFATGILSVFYGIFIVL